MIVPFVDLKAQYRVLQEEIDQAIKQVIDSSSFILGKAVSDFEERFANAHGVRHCVAVGSGTDSLHLSLWSAGVRDGEEVITVPFTFIATAEAILLTGAKLIFVDIDHKTFTMDVSKLVDAITPKTKAIIPVHLYGQCAAMDDIMKIAERYNLIVIEDAAQAHLAKYKNKYTGQWGTAACFSFYPVKNLGAFGEAGAVITNEDELAATMRQLRDHGQVEKYLHRRWGHNYRMDGIQGAVLGVKLKYLQQWTERRRQIAELYRNLLEGTGDLILPYVHPEAYHVYHLFVVLTKHRLQLRNYLAEHGIATAIHYSTPLHCQPAFQALGYAKGSFPVSESVAEQCLALPMYAELLDEQVYAVAERIQKFFYR